MECVGYTIEAEVPPESLTVTACSTAFFRVASSLDQLDGKEAIRKHTLFTTNRGYILEVEDGKVLRSAPSPNDVSKIVVHHDFEPLQLYIVMLCHSRTAVLMTYHDFKVLEEWDGMCDIASTDVKATGSPELILTKLNNDKVVIPNTKLMSYAHGRKGRREAEEGEEEDDAAGKKEAVQALMHRFKGGIKLVEELRTERKVKENFIAEELAVLQSRLKGQVDEKEKGLVPALNVEERKVEVKESLPSMTPNPLRVLQVYHKLVHDKWVVGMNVINDGEQVLVSEIEVILCCGEVRLRHTSQVVKTVKHSGRHGEADVTVTVDHLDPPILRPKKRATVVGVCEVPSFETGPSVSCSGLLSYTCKPLKTPSNQPVNDKCQNQEYQVSVRLVELEASELHNHLASFELCSMKTVCVTFSTVALVAASRCTQVSLTSLVSPLTTFLTKISCHLKLVKVCVVSDFYVLYSGESHPLQYTGFTLHTVDSHNLNLNLYTKDEKQALVLAHTLLAALPEDASMQFLPDSKDTGSSTTEPQNLHHMLLAGMREAATHVTDGLEAQLNNNKAPTIQRKEGSGKQEDGFTKYMKEREELQVKNGDITFKGKEYSVWRNKLHDIQTKVDSLYLKFLKKNCASDF